MKKFFFETTGIFEWTEFLYTVKPVLMGHILDKDKVAL